MVPLVPNGINVTVEWYQRNYPERSQCLFRFTINR